MSIICFLKKMTLGLIFFAVTALAADAVTTPKNYISYDLEYKPYEKMRRGLEKKLAVRLKHLNEAHITVITPPEFDRITKKIDIEKIQVLAEEFLKSKPEYEVVCVGSRSLKIKNKLQKTYFAVVKSPALLQFRQKVASLTALPTDVFNPDQYYPHITLGFTSRDLHLEDGVIKDEKSCMK